jgi:hypothetical protein
MAKQLQPTSTLMIVGIAIIIAIWWGTRGGENGNG